MGRSPQLARSVDETVTHRIERCLCAGGDPKLEVDVLYVVARGLLGDHELLRDVAAGHAAGDEQQDLELACGEPGGAGTFAGAGAGVTGGGQDVLRRVSVDAPSP